MRAVGDDREIERAVTAEVPVDHHGAAVLAHHVDDLGARHQLRWRALEAAMQQVEQHAAPDAESVRLGVQVGIGKVEHHAAMHRPGLEPDHLAALRQRRLFDTERAQHGKARGLKQKPRT